MTLGAIVFVLFWPLWLADTLWDALFGGAEE